MFRVQLTLNHILYWFQSHQCSKTILLASSHIGVLRWQRLASPLNDDWLLLLWGATLATIGFASYGALRWQRLASPMVGDTLAMIGFASKQRLASPSLYLIHLK